MVFNLVAQPKPRESGKAFAPLLACSMETAGINVQYGVYKIYTWLFCDMVYLKMSDFSRYQTESTGVR